MTCTGIVKGKVVLLDDDSADLRDGTRVLVSAIEGHQLTRTEAIELLLSDPIRRSVGMDGIIEEDKIDREERASQWLPNPRNG